MRCTQLLGGGLLPLTTPVRARVRLAGSVVASPVAVTLWPPPPSSDRAARLILVACTSDDVYAVNRDAALTRVRGARPATSHLRLPGPVFATPLVVARPQGSAGATAVLPSADRAVYGVSITAAERRGVRLEQLWRVATGAPCFAPAALVPAGWTANPSFVLLAAEEAASAHSLRAGEKRRRSGDDGSAAAATPLGDGGGSDRGGGLAVVVVGCHDGRLFCLDASTGAVVWCAPLTASGSGGATAAPISTAATFALIASTGSSGERPGAAAAALPCVVAAASDGSVHVLHAATGAPLARPLRLPGEVFSSPAAVPGLNLSGHCGAAVLFVGCRDDSLHDSGTPMGPPGHWQCQWPLA